MRNSLLYSLVSGVLFWGLFNVQNMHAQRISFGLYGDGLVMTPVGPGTLNFSEKHTVLVSGSGDLIHIDLINDPQLVAVIEITGREELDVTVEIDHPVELELEDDENEKIPFQLRWAWSNSGIPDFEQSKADARELPDGVTSATFPIVRRSSGPPGPPPVPSHDGYEAPMATAYLFIYGSLGPVGEVHAGLYSAMINIYAEYSAYD